VLEHCLEGEANIWFPITLRRFLLTDSLGGRRLSIYISLFTVAIHVNFTSELLKLYQRIPETFEATMYNVRYCQREKINCRDVSMMDSTIGGEGATR
jgi:hypothetical protein